MKRPYQSPALTCFGAICNFTTGGSGRKSEWKYKSVNDPMGMGNSGEGTWKRNYKKKNNTIKP